MAKKKNTTRPTKQPKPVPEEAAKPVPEEASDPLALAVSVSSLVQISDVALVSLSAERSPSASQGEMVVTINVDNVELGVSPENGRIFVSPSFSLAARKRGDDESSPPVVWIKAKFAVAYICESVGEIPQQNLEAFANTNGVYNAWPYWREIVMNTSMRLRVNPITIPVFRL